LDEDDLKNTENAVKRFAQNEEQKQLWEMSRKEILSISDYIIPGKCWARFVKFNLMFRIRSAVQRHN
jgi:hypothetical protein